MKFQRLNENEIRCVLSEADLTRFGIKLDDILEKSDKTLKFFSEILREAFIALGIKGAGEIRVASAQISVLPDNSISIIFHDCRRDLSLDIRREILDMMEEQLKLGGNGCLEALSEIRALREELELEEKEFLKEKASFVVSFPSLNEAIDYISGCGAVSRVVSSLYKDRRNGSYLLFVLKHILSDSVFQRLKLIAGEYGRVMELSIAGEVFLLENSDCIIKENAFGGLRSLNCFTVVNQKL